ncbi:MAG: aminoglycoside phosphotransferase family protein [Acidobacteriia bacterium]|nr:aminoglycoside phosphotransferase family protein [Terriglobia bacterium]
MVTATQRERETYRVIVLGQDGKDVLVVPSGDRLTLPFVEIPRWQRVAENLTAAVRTDWGEEVICLFERDDLAGTDGIERHYQAAEHWCATGTPKAPTRWVPISALSDGSLTASDYLAIQRSIAQSDVEGRGSPAGPFTRLGWFKELRQWIEEVIEPLGLNLNGNFNQLNASPSFSLIRFETDGPALWFKSVGEPNQKEFPITCALAELFPGHVPSVLATRPEWNGWLTREASGNLLCDVQEKALWEKAAVAVAELQIESIDHGARILQAGTRDLGVNALSRMVKPFVETMTQLMELQTKVPPMVLDRKGLLLLGDRIETALEALNALGIPETLGHLDLNHGNIIVSPCRCAFLDWAEAYVGNPFFTFQYLLEFLRRTIGAHSPIETRLIASYCQKWERIVPRGAIEDALALSPLLAVFAYAAGSNAWQDEKSLQDPATAGYLRGLTRRMHREATALSERRSLCLH